MPKAVSLANSAEDLSLSVTPEAGGELSGLRLRRGKAWTELIHHASHGWRGGAPWLFPAVGRSFHEGMGRYLLDGEVYEMPIHGFVMDRPWELVRADEGEIVCRTRDDAQTRKLYPFGFSLTVAYSLENSVVRADVTVEADAGNGRPMPFSLGNHLTLAVPDPARCRVRSPAKDVLALKPDGLLSGQVSPSPYVKGRSLAEDPGLRDRVLGGFPGGQALVEVGIDDARLRVSQPDSPWARFVFYSDGRSFFCPEPWLGEPDSLNTGRGLVRLAPGGRFAWAMALEVL